eukprot:CAMPEP_0168735660 /NCGR_PEP_ID=MMETSP0724-20121128/9451_1 /TAXON_ID=265536 /ORGANISM="Amphiprora sp., Strain CCMP467" /LENGTH=121 /DNA_ID=CAMNT_0008782817 /DNA_START=278 /DNA_END=639 /DNA_ORIENTATION=-
MMIGSTGGIAMRRRRHDMPQQTNYDMLLEVVARSEIIGSVKTVNVFQPPGASPPAKDALDAWMPGVSGMVEDGMLWSLQKATTVNGVVVVAVVVAAAECHTKACATRKLTVEPGTEPTGHG